MPEPPAPKPTDAELKALRAVMTVPQIAESFRVGRGTVDRWIRDARDRGEVITSPYRQHPRVKSGAELNEIRAELLERVLDIALDDTIVAPKDKIAQARLALDAYTALGAFESSTRAEPESRGELLAKVKKATQSATRLRCA